MISKIRCALLILLVLFVLGCGSVSQSIFTKPTPMAGAEKWVFEYMEGRSAEELLDYALWVHAVDLSADYPLAVGDDLRCRIGIIYPRLGGFAWEAGLWVVDGDSRGLESKTDFQVRSSQFEDKEIIPGPYNYVDAAVYEIFVPAEPKHYQINLKITWKGNKVEKLFDLGIYPGPKNPCLQ